MIQYGCLKGAWRQASDAWFRRRPRANTTKERRNENHWFRWYWTVRGCVHGERGKYTARKLEGMGLAGYLVDEGRIQVGDPLGMIITIR